MAVRVHHRPAFPPLLALLAPICALVLYLNALSNPLLTDERQWTVENPQVVQPLTARALWLTPTPPDGGAPAVHRPVQVLLSRFEHALWDASPSSYHSVGPLFFVALVIALFFLSGSLVEHPGARLALVLTFAVHPLATQSVQSIQGQGTLLSLLACLLACLVLQRARSGRLRLAWTAALMILLGFIAAGAAELGLLLPVWLLAVAALSEPSTAVVREGAPRRKKAEAAAKEAPATHWRGGLWLAAGLPVLVMTIGEWVLRTLTLKPAAADLLAGLGQPWLAAPSVMLLALKRLCWPVQPTLFYTPAFAGQAAGEPNLLPPPALGWAALAVLGLALGWALARRRRLLALGLVFFLSALAALAPWRSRAVYFSEENLIFALPGLTLLVASGVRALASAPRRRVARERAVQAVLIAAWVAMAWQTWTRGQDWKSAETLWRAEARRHPANAQPLIELFESYTLAQNESAARDAAAQARRLATPAQLDRIIQIETVLAATQKDDVRLQALFSEALSTPRPRPEGYFVKLALFARDRKMASTAERLLRRELADHPKSFDALYELADVTLERGNAKEALQLSDQAAANAPNAQRAKAQARYAYILGETGNPNAALEQARTAQKLDPTLYLPYLTIARILWARGDLAGAEAVIQGAFKNVNLTSYTDLAQIYTGVLEDSNRTKDAIAWMTNMVMQYPQDVPLQLFGAFFLIQYRHYDEAMAIYRNLFKPLQAARDPQFADVLTGLGMIANDRDHNADKALDYWRQALRINPKQPQAIQLVQQRNNAPAPSTPAVPAAPATPAAPTTATAPAAPVNTGTMTEQGLSLAPNVAPTTATTTPAPTPAPAAGPAAYE